MVTLWSVDVACGCAWTIWEDWDRTSTWVQHGDNPEHRRHFSCSYIVEHDADWQPVRDWISEVNDRCLATKAV